MGMVLLDMTFRVERAFRVRVPKGWHEQLGISWQDGGSDATLGQYHEFVLRLCKEQGAVVPAESWPMLIRIVEDASGLDRAQITPETRIVHDIGPMG
jgi:hypothetical protein